MLTFFIVVGLGIGALLALSPNEMLAPFRNNRRKSIANLADRETTKIIGVIDPIKREEMLTAPLTGRACVAYIATVHEEVGESTRRIIEEIDCVSFSVSDETGRALIDPTQANLILDTELITNSGTFDAATPTEQAFLARHGEDSASKLLGLNRSLTYEEKILHVGEKVALVGRVTMIPDPQGAARAQGYRSAAPLLAHFQATPQVPLVISDWELARKPDSNKS